MGPFTAGCLAGGGRWSATWQAAAFLHRNEGYASSMAAPIGARWLQIARLELFTGPALNTVTMVSVKAAVATAAAAAVLVSLPVLVRVPVHVVVVVAVAATVAAVVVALAIQRDVLARYARQLHPVPSMLAKRNRRAQTAHTAIKGDDTSLPCLFGVGKFKGEIDDVIHHPHPLLSLSLSLSLSLALARSLTHTRAHGCLDVTS